MIKLCKGDIQFDIDEYVCYDVIIDDMIKFKLVFVKENGMVMVGNVLGLNDVGVVLVLMECLVVEKCGLKLLVCLVLYGYVGVDLKIMGIGLVLVMCKVLECVGLLVKDLDVIEVNEVFVVQVCVVMKEFGLDLVKVNLNGLGILFGYLIGVMGVFIMVKVLYEL